MEFVVLIESSSINMAAVIPLERSLGSHAFMKLSFINIPLPLFNSLPLELVVLETAFIMDSLRQEFAAMGLRAVMVEISAVERSISEDVSSLPVCVAMVEIPQVNRAVRFVHGAETVGLQAVLNGNLVTSSKLPAYTSQPYLLT